MIQNSTAVRRRGAGLLARLLLLGAICPGLLLTRAGAGEPVNLAAGSFVLPIREGEPQDPVDAFLESRRPGSGSLNLQADPGPQPLISSLRPIQYTYVPGGGTVVVLWKLYEPGVYQIAVRVDGRFAKTIGKDMEGRFPGGVRLDNLKLGWHRLGFEAFPAGGGASYKVETVITVLAESPVMPVSITRWIAYAFQPEEESGRLEIQWQKPESQAEPYVEFEFFVNGVFQGRSAAGREALTFSEMKPGNFKVEIIAFTENYAAPPAARMTSGMPVEAPLSAVCEKVTCSESSMKIQAAFELAPFDIPDAIAVWALNREERRFIGLFNASPRRLVIEELPLKPVILEFAGANRIFEEGDPLMLSGLPAAAGQIVQVRCRPGPECLPPGWFQRGDVEVDGVVQITDAITILGFLFNGLEFNGCLDSMDSNDDGSADVSDGIYLLNFLFLGTVPPPPPPGPFECGPDPTSDPLGDCQMPACAA